MSHALVDEGRSVSALRLEGLSKRFAGTKALDDVDFEVGFGEVRGLVGENGAGKSTLIKILAGVYTPDDGTIEVDGRVLESAAERSGIAFVHQDLGLVDELSVAENLGFATGFPRRLGLIQWRPLWAAATAAYERMGLQAPSPRTLVGRLSAAEKALLGVVRALASDARVVILDEPTASLPAPDVTHLLEALERLKGAGAAIVYVTHRLQELYRIADSVTVLRSGRKVAEGSMSEFGMDRLVEAMLGRPVASVPTSPAPEADAESVLLVEDLVVGSAPPVSLRVNAGEIVGLVGLRGAGQERIGRALAGAEPLRSGAVTLHGSPLRGHGVSRRMAEGVALLPADRQRESTFGLMSVAENLFPGPRNTSSPGTLIRRATESTRARALIEEYDVRPPRPALPIDQLSGGNQQKVVVARLLGQPQRLVVLEEPTAGVDIGSKLEIHNFVRRAAGQGTGVVVVSSDMEEVAQLCTRVLVVVEGAITAEVPADQISEEHLVLLASAPSPERKVDQ